MESKGGRTVPSAHIFIACGLCPCRNLRILLFCHSCSGSRKIARFCGWAKAGIGTKQCERSEPNKRTLPVALACATPPLEGNLVRDKNVASSPPSGPTKLINFVGDSTEEYPKREVVFLLLCAPRRLADADLAKLPDGQPALFRPFAAVSRDRRIENPPRLRGIRDGSPALALGLPTHCRTLWSGSNPRTHSIN